MFLSAVSKKELLKMWSELLLHNLGHCAKRNLQATYYFSFTGCVWVCVCVCPVRFAGCVFVCICASSRIVCVFEACAMCSLCYLQGMCVYVPCVICMVCMCPVPFCVCVCVCARVRVCVLFHLLYVFLHRELNPGPDSENTKS